MIYRKAVKLNKMISFNKFSLNIPNDLPYSIDM